MDKNKIRINFDKAGQYLEEAKSELNRPAEDVVPYMVCRSARYSLVHYLQGFLEEHGEIYNTDDTVRTLLDKCRGIDGKFDQIDLSAFTFTKDDEFSAEFDEMESCVDLAELAKQMVGE